MKMRATSRARDKELAVNNDWYMGANDYTTVSAIANERGDIGITTSSTPSGKRGTFYKMCMDKSMGYKEFYFPSSVNPNWTEEMDLRARAENTDSQYMHEVLAEFGTEELGVFNKELLDAAMKKEFYIYDELNDIQKRNLQDDIPPTEYIYDENNPAPYNPYRCLGIDWDKLVA